MPAGPVLFCVAGLAGALVARGTAYVGRFSIHLMPVAVALATSFGATALDRVRRRSRTVGADPRVPPPPASSPRATARHAEAQSAKAAAPGR